MRRWWIWPRRHSHDPLVCREFVALVTDYLEGALPDEERMRFEAHLAECDGCSGYLEDMRRLVGSLNVLPAPTPDSATREALLAAFRELRKPGAR
jgi:anti-sigma factor RsiW